MIIELRIDTSICNNFVPNKKYFHFKKDVTSELKVRDAFLQLRNSCLETRIVKYGCEAKILKIFPIQAGTSVCERSYNVISLDMQSHSRSKSIRLIQV